MRAPLLAFPCRHDSPKGIDVPEEAGGEEASLNHSFNRAPISSSPTSVTTTLMETYIPSGLSR